MNKINKYGMLFYENNVPDFGSIEKIPCSGNVVLLAEDIPKLNSVLTQAGCQAYLVENESFSFHTGDLAYIIDWITEESGAVYMYHSGTDCWYEIIPNE